MKKSPNIEKILLNEKIPLHKITLNRQSIFDNNSQTIRWYVPDWNKIINTGILLDLLIEKNYLLPNQREFHFNLTQIYLLLTFLPTPIAKRENLTGRRTRKFNINTLLYNPIYHENLFSFKDPSPGKIKAYLRQLTQKEKDERLETIIRTKIYPFLDTKTPIIELIQKAFSEKELNLPLSKMGDEYFTTAVYDNALRILKDKFIGRDLILNPISKKDAEYIRENILPDPIIEELRDDKLSDILEKLEKPYKILREAINQKKPIQYLQSIIDKNAYLVLTEELINFLILKQKRKFNKTKISEINELVNFVTQIRNLPDEDKWKGLLIIRDRFYKQTDTLLFFVNKLGDKIKEHLKNFSTLIFNDLITQEKLSQEEKRFFIISNRGLPSYDQAIPIFERGILEFFNFNNFILPLFIEVTLNRITKYEQIDLKEFLDYQLRIFLKFYPIWHDEIKSSEREIKRYTRTKKTTTQLDVAYHKDIKASNPNELVDLIGCEEELLKICNEREVKVFTEKKLLNIPLTKIAEEQKVSPQMIGKIYNRAKTKILKHYSK